MVDLLIEIGTEEIPAGYLRPAASWLEASCAAALASSGLASTETTAPLCLAGPRRIALFVGGLLAARPASSVERTGPKRAACFDASGAPTKALAGFARSAGVEPEEVQFREVPGKGEVACSTALVPGQDAAEILPSLLLALISGVPFPKSMRWVSREHTFCRPVRSLLALLDGQVLPMVFAEVESGREVAGHPFLAPTRAVVDRADLTAYTSTLESLSVLVRFEARRDRIRDEIAGIRLQGRTLAEAGLQVEVSEALLDEVANLVEWPGVLLGDIDAAFMDLPEEVILEPMKVQQRYFPIRRIADGRLVNHFVVAHNRGQIAREDSPIAAGNARVLRARLADAKFFFENDRVQPLESLLPKLDGVVFRQGQGTMRQKSARLEGLTAVIAARLMQTGPNPAAKTRATRATRILPAADLVTVQEAARAGLLAKADLASEMVFEFPELQGTMGRIYAELQLESPRVAAAIGAHYGPRVQDPLPEDVVVVSLCLAEKLDNLASATLAGALARGNRDPFGTRRDAIALLRILYEGGHSVDLDSLLECSGEGFAGVVEVEWNAQHQQALRAFLHDRLTVTFREAGHDHERVAAVLAAGASNLALVRVRLEAVDELAGHAVWPQLVEALERTANITKQWSAPPGFGGVTAAHIEAGPEQNLFTAFTNMRPSFEAQVAEGRYYEASLLYADRLSEALHEFFGKVFVNAEEPELRNNRMALLRSIHDIYASSIADLALVNLKR